MKHIILGGGCFWCTEAVFKQVRGVSEVISGYAGGTADQANYDAVCGGSTGHVEVIKVVFDEAKIGLSDLLLIFFATHDPTQLNRQGNDVGTQYASVIFYEDEEQKQAGEQVIAALKADGLDVKTRLDPAPEFFKAEDYHQDFYARNPSQGYCNAVIPPKLAKLQSKFVDYLK
jgi:peptide-methionine (S)-S-oxide reductase